MKLLRCVPLFALCAVSLVAVEPPAASKAVESQLKGVEGEFVSLVEAMPADKFGFAPKDGAFQGVRTFAQQAKHVAFVNYTIAAALLDEKNPSAGGKDENGPADLQTKEQIVKYVKDSFAYAHKAVATLTDDTIVRSAADPFNPAGRRSRMESVLILISHPFDHYGQMVEYARMNNVIPPASR